MAALTKSDIHFNIFGNDKSKKAFDSFKKNTNQANQTLKTLRNTIVAAFSTREIVLAANVMIGVENRMNALTGSAAETAMAMDHMRRIASDSRSDFDAVAMLFTRLALATEHLGATQQDVADATQTVANTFIIAGSHAQEANNSARQLAQGLASGALRGDELRSVMENNTILTKMLAEGLDMTIGELREFGHAGKLTAETVMPILIKGTQETNAEISKMPMTLGQAMVALRNNFQFIIGDVQKATNSFSTLSAVIGKFANNLDGLLIPAFFAMIAVIGKAMTMVKPFMAMLAANPLIWIPAALTALYVFRDEFVYGLKLIGKQLEIFDVKGQIAINKLYIGFLKFINWIKGKFVDLQNSFIESINGMRAVLRSVGDMSPFIKKALGLDALEDIPLRVQPDTENIKKQEEFVASLAAKLPEILSKEIKKEKIPSIMDMLLGRDPNDPNGRGATGFTAMKPLEKFLSDAEKGFGDFQTKIKTMQEEMQGVFQKTYDNLTNMTMDFLEKGKASFKDFATSIVRELIRIAVQKLIIDRMFASFGRIIGNVRDTMEYAKLTDNDTLFDMDYGIGNKALGGFVKGGKPYMVGESGRELFIPSENGQIVSNQNLKQAAPTPAPTVNFNISTVDAAGFDQLLTSRRGLITQIINNAMNNQGKMGIT